MYIVKDIKLKDLDKCMRVVLQNCNSFNRMWRDDELQEFCENPVNRNSLFALENEGYIELISADGGIILAVITLEKGFTYFAKKQNELKQFLMKSVFVPIVVSTITTLITIGITHLFT